MNEKIEQACLDYLNGLGTISELGYRYKIKKELIKNSLKAKGYEIKRGGGTYLSVINTKKAVDEYINNLDNEPSLTQIASKYSIDRGCLSLRLKSMGIEIINHLNKSKFNEHIFDSIDTEEKAYWLGFIYADGYIATLNDKNSEYTFEISLKESDKVHLDKFNSFMLYKGNNVKVGNVTCNNVVCKRCRWCVSNKHLWTTLNYYGCTPRKSLTLEFPKKDIFKDESLIRHFIRGYFDGDGCLSYCDKMHLRANVSVLGTLQFLQQLQIYLSINHKIHHKSDKLTCILSACGKTGYRVAKYLYADATIYLNRKYERYLEYCRLYEKSYKGLQSNIGEVCDDNTEIIKEAKESLTSLSVEIEPEKSE